MSKSSDNLNLWQKIRIEIIWALCRAISFTPAWFKYRALAPFVYFIVYKCLKYRVEVVNENLRNSFPEKSREELNKIRDDFYVILSEIMVSTVALAGGKPENQIIHQPQQSTSLERLKEATAGKSWLALTAHYGLWEYFMFWAQYADQYLVAVYHKLENPVFEVVFQRLRKARNVVTVPLNETVRYCLEHRDGIEGHNFVIGLIADQNPPRRPNSEWHDFLNQETIFFDGGEKIARKLSLPVYFLYQRRIAPGKYEFEYEPIYNGTDPIEPGEITRRYVKMLERVIIENPHMWLWTHRRWKHKH